MAISEHSPTIMVVDDTPANLKLLDQMLRMQGYRALTFPKGELALKAAKKKPPDLILLDIMMPEMDGFEFCAKLKGDPELKEIPVIFISALGETSDKVKAFAAGGVDYVSKPFQFEEVHARVQTHLRLHQMKCELEQYNDQLESMVEEKVQEISEAQLAIITALSKVAESRDDQTGSHIERTSNFCKVLALQLKSNSPYSEEIDEGFINNIFSAAPLHDIGKVGIPDDILLKPGKLTADEFELMKGHTEIGEKTLLKILERYPKNPLLILGIEIARSHHEKWDGSGYPYQLSGTDIPLSARIMAVADVYDALRSVRPYKTAMNHHDAFEIIKNGNGTHFDPHIIKGFIIVEKEFAQIYDKLKENA